MGQNFVYTLSCKTDVNCQDDTFLLCAVLDNDPHIEEWSVNLEDEDRVLRIIYCSSKHQQIIELLTEPGCCCFKLN